MGSCRRLALVVGDGLSDGLTVSAFPRQGKSAKRIRNFGKRIGSEGWERGSRPEPVGCRRTARAALAVRAGHRVPAGGRTGNGPLGGLPRASNSRLRTGQNSPKTGQNWPFLPARASGERRTASEAWGGTFPAIQKPHPALCHQGAEADVKKKQARALRPRLAVFCATVRERGRDRDGGTCSTLLRGRRRRHCSSDRSIACQSVPHRTEVARSLVLQQHKAKVYGSDRQEASTKCSARSCIAELSATARDARTTPHLDTSAQGISLLELYRGSFLQVAAQRLQKIFIYCLSKEEEYKAIYRASKPQLLIGLLLKTLTQVKKKQARALRPRLAVFCATVRERGRDRDGARAAHCFEVAVAGTAAATAALHASLCLIEPKSLAR
ncbi:hypothetical protein C4D60_Mb10t26910 [Musa balbisiana]|uniref:Uncharacterized protein n=1 Tax=Musa balbisiana TaxID=52838 RepID=A0A4S8J0Y8_MUSBA|nr:hypothetical protein C4D60_Mb10t26910 [Musa balbisiana]